MGDYEKMVTVIGNWVMEISMLFSCLNWIIVVGSADVLHVVVKVQVPCIEA